MSKYLREKLPELGFVQTDEKQFVKEITKYGFMVYDENDSYKITLLLTGIL